MKKRMFALGESKERSLIIEGKLYDVDEKIYKQVLKILDDKTKPQAVSLKIKKIRDWSEDELKMLGVVTDGVIADKLGISPIAVGKKRRNMGIPACSTRGTKWGREWSKNELKLLGKVPDKEVAEKLGISNATVSLKRRELGISKFSKPSREWSKDEIALLGTYPDTIVSEKLGLPNHVVYLKRRSLNILAYNRQEFEEEPQREMPKLDSKERKLARDIYDIYDKSKTLVQAVDKIKKFTRKKDDETLKRVSTYLTVKYDDNFPLERCLTLVGIF